MSARPDHLRQAERGESRPQPYTFALGSDKVRDWDDSWTERADGVGQAGEKHTWDKKPSVTNPLRLTMRTPRETRTRTSGDRADSQITRRL